MNGLRASWRLIGILTAILLIGSMALSACGAAATATPAPVATEAPVATVAPTQAPAAPTAASAGGEQKKIVVWWWGEQEAPGLEKWFNETKALFEKANPSIKIESTLEGTDNVISNFAQASAAGNPPDLQYAWNGIYHMEAVWQGYVEPLTGLIPEDKLKPMYASPLSFDQGKQWRAGWYMLPMGWAYNKALFTKAGLKPELPKTWDELLNTCDKLQAAGITPFGAGLKDGFWGEWYVGFSLIQQEDQISDTTKLISGELKWSDPRWYKQWDILTDFFKRCVNKDANSLELYQGGIEQFSAGKVAMIQTILTAVPSAVEQLGMENVGVGNMPVFGEGKLAGKPVLDVQGWMISSKSKVKKEAADFIQFMHTQERLDAMWDQVHIMPADTNWNPGNRFDNDPITKQEWDEWVKGENVPYVPNMTFGDLDPDAFYPGPQKIMNGEATGAEVGKMAEDASTRWREENPDLANFRKKWGESLNSGT